MKYRKKPVVIEAVQFTRDKVNKVHEFTDNNLFNVLIPRCPDGVMTAHIKTSEGMMAIREKDYITKDEDGKFSHCPPITFEKTYEKVE